MRVLWLSAYQVKKCENSGWLSIIDLEDEAANFSQMGAGQFNRTGIQRTK